jgi:hypothetical protein
VEISKLLPDDEAGCAEAVAVKHATAKLDSPEMLQPTARG